MFPAVVRTRRLPVFGSALVTWVVSLPCRPIRQQHQYPLAHRYLEAVSDKDEFQLQLRRRQLETEDTQIFIKNCPLMLGSADLMLTVARNLLPASNDQPCTSSGLLAGFLHRRHLHEFGEHGPIYR